MEKEKIIFTWSGGKDRETRILAQTFIDLRFKAVIVCVDTEELSAEFAGMEFDTGFLSELSPGIDPCGENGEFHSFVYDGPIFRRQINFKNGEKVLREHRFCFCELLPEGVRC